jgi:hypothetical protein
MRSAASNQPRELRHEPGICLASPIFADTPYIVFLHSTSMNGVFGARRNRERLVGYGPNGVKGLHQFVHDNIHLPYQPQKSHGVTADRVHIKIHYP